MLWHVDSATLRILGSVHFSNRPLLLSEQTILALSDSTVLAFEANFDVAPNLAPMRYETENALSRNIPLPLFADTQRLWRELGLNEDELERLRPWWVAFRLMNAALSNRGFVQERGIDRSVLNFGKKEGKTLFFLESVDAGLLPFGNAPLREQEIFLSRVVQHTEEGLQEVASLVAAWESGDSDSLLPIVERALRLMPIAYSAALGGRNKAWLRHLLRLTRSGRNAVAVIGVLHMVGPDNIPSLLAAAGYKCSLTPECP